jgi:hypothetical protein
VFVEASGFAANLTLRTSGNRQTVQISSKGEIRGVNITMVKSWRSVSQNASSQHKKPRSDLIGTGFFVWLFLW